MKTLYRWKWFQVFLAWYDGWIGFFYDRKARALYVFPFFFIGLRFQLPKRKDADIHHMGTAHIVLNWNWKPYNPLPGDDGKTLWGYHAKQGRLIVDVYEGNRRNEQGKKVWYGYILNENGGVLTMLFHAKAMSTGTDARWEAEKRFVETITLFDFAHDPEILHLAIPPLDNGSYCAKGTEGKACPLWHGMERCRAGLNRDRERKPGSLCPRGKEIR